MKRCIVAVLLLTVTTTATAEIGNTVNNFTNSFFYENLYLKFLQVDKLSKGIFKFDGYYYLSERLNEVYLAELITNRDEREIISQAIYFPDDTTKWNLFVIAEFTREAVGHKMSLLEIIPVIKPMFAEASYEFLMLDEYEKQHTSVIIERTLGDYKFVLKRLSAGDWVLTIDGD
jgi:hypothetical protein